MLIQAAGSTFGTYFHDTTFGESHVGGVGCVIDGCPPRLPISEADMQVETMVALVLVHQPMAQYAQCNLFPLNPALQEPMQLPNLEPAKISLGKMEALRVVVGWIDGCLGGGGLGSVVALGGSMGWIQGPQQGVAAAMEQTVVMQWSKAAAVQWRHRGRFLRRQVFHVGGGRVAALDGVWMRVPLFSALLLSDSQFSKSYSQFLNAFIIAMLRPMTFKRTPRGNAKGSPVNLMIEDQSRLTEKRPRPNCPEPICWAVVDSFQIQHKLEGNTKLWISWTMELKRVAGGFWQVGGARVHGSGGHWRFRCWSRWWQMGAVLGGGIMVVAAEVIGAHGGFWVRNREAAVMDRQQGGSDVTEQGGSSAMEATRLVSQAAALTSWQHGGSISAAHSADNGSTGMGRTSLPLWGNNRGWFSGFR
ncbi:hypothetical protein RHMOL_Rhmol05G0035600 [Rhododendron molle]|uniref:Uncharacterized protein n=1 Tax=Rhododendron molle TaxID=49168 RepID=A0ACC0NLP5_RHOML|nr:hypothetical protein RHMOL_Rhmol05G0035600 [Rhododendron molle]